MCERGKGQMSSTRDFKVKKIYKRAIAIELRRLGFKIIGTEVNETKPEFDVYLFEDTEEFEKGFTQALNIFNTKRALAN